MYQNNLKNIASFFKIYHLSRAIDVICNNTKENFLREGPEKANVKFHKMTSYTKNFQNFTCVFTILVKFDIYFFGLP